jgi:PRC-barrel domain protein
MDQPRPGLRYVDADDLDDSTIEFDGMNVESNTGEKLGDVDGFIIDLRSARPYYVVVDAGSWFTSKYVLLPVGHIALDADRRKLIADVPQDRVRRFPGFDREQFAQLSEAELNRMDEQMASACCPGETLAAGSAVGVYEARRHYQSPSWWDASYYRPDRVDAAARSMGGTGTSSSYAGAPDRAEPRDREQVVARRADDETVGDVSPHFAGRAQPGDVLGLETGGEQTHVGETSEDENKRRREGEKTAEKDRSRK